MYTVHWCTNCESLLGTLYTMIYHLAGNVISATVGFVYINLQPEYELPSSTHFGQFQ